MNNSLKPITLAFFVALSFALGCASTDSIGNNGLGHYQLRVEMANRAVSRSFSGNHSPKQAGTVQSLTVSAIRLIITEIKVQRKDSPGEEKLDTGAVVLAVDSSGPQAMVTGYLPSGVYNKVAFKFHRFNDPEAAEYGHRERFADFVTPERYTIIFEGTVDGSTPFTYKSTVEEGFKLDIPEFTVVWDNSTFLTLVLNMNTIFKDKDIGAILDPRDPSNANRIDTEVKAALSMLWR